MCGGRESIVRSGLRWRLASARDRIGGGVENQGNVRRDLPSKMPEDRRPGVGNLSRSDCDRQGPRCPIRRTILQACSPVLRGGAPPRGRRKCFRGKCSRNKCFGGTNFLFLMVRSASEFIIGP